MKPVVDAERCEVQVLVCTNEREPGKSCCHKVGGMDFFTKLKTRVREEGLRGTHFITRTGCLGYCNDVGTTVVIHRRAQTPEWLSEVTAADFGTVWERTVRK